MELNTIIDIAYILMIIVILVKWRTVKLSIGSNDDEEVVRQDSIYRHFVGDTFIILDEDTNEIFGYYILHRHYDVHNNETHWKFAVDNAIKYNSIEFDSKLLIKGDSKYLNKKMLMDLAKPGSKVLKTLLRT